MPLLSPVATLRFEVPGTCVSKANFRRSGKDWRKRWERIKGYEASVQEHALKAQARLLNARFGKRPLSVEVLLFNQPKNLDLDGACKNLWDALQNVAYSNDAQIVHSTLWKMRDPGERRVRLTVRYLEEMEWMSCN